MFIFAYICFAAAAILLIVAIVLYFKLDVKTAYDFIKHKRKDIHSNSVKRGKTHKRAQGSSRRDVSRSVNQLKKESSAGGPVKAGAVGPKKVSRKLVKSADTSESETDLLNEDSENATSLLSDDAEQPTGILSDDAEQPTGILSDDAEQPTGILTDEAEQPTGILTDDAEKPTGVLTDEAEKPTGILSDDAEQPTDVLSEEKIVHAKPKASDKATGQLYPEDEPKPKGKKPKKVVEPAKKPKLASEENDQSEFRFEIVKNEVVIHTDELID